MKRLLLYIVVLFIPSFVSGQEQEIVEGVYRGKDIFVQNPYLNVEGAFCIMFIEVNGVKIIENPAVSAVKIDLSRFEIDSPIKIIVQHHGICQPKILNPDVLKVGSAFKYVQITADDASISWLTTGEMPGTGAYMLEKLKLDGWEAISRIPGKGNLDTNQYSVGVEHYAGDNRYRLHYLSKEGDIVSDEFEFYSDMDPISHYPESTVYNILSLSRPTDYVIKNHQGDILLKGVGQDIILDALPYGELTLVIENREELIFRPEPEIIERPKKGKGKKNEPH